MTSTTLPNITHKNNPAAGDLALIVDAANSNATRLAPVDAFSQTLGIYNVKSYGAKGDGVTDDTAAIQAAINAAAAVGTDAVVPYQYKGACVFLPAGTYVVTQITMKHHVTLAGTGPGSVLFQQAAYAGSAMIICGANDLFLRLRDFRIDGNYANQTQSAGVGPHGIYFDYSAAYNNSLDEESDPYPFISGLEIYNVNGTAIKLIGRGEAHIEHTMIRNALGDGVTVCYDSRITNNSIAVCGGAGINVGNDAQGGSVVITGNKIFHAGNPNPAATGTYNTATHGGAGIYIFNSSGVVMEGNYIQDCAGAGVNGDTITDCQFTGTIDSISQANSGDPAVNLANSHNNQFSGAVRDRAPDGTNYYMRHVVRTWSFAVTPCYNNAIHMTYDLDTTNPNHYPVYPTSMNSHADGGVGEDIVLGNQNGTQSVAYAATITPNPYLGGTILVGTLTGNITVANTAAYNKHVGVRLTFVFTQDATGGRTVTWGTDYKTNWTPNTAANKVNVISFVWSGSNWLQMAAQTGL